MISLLVFLGTATPHSTIPCWLVHAYIEVLGEKAARAKGKAHGYTDAEIDAVRARCFVK